MTIAPHDASTVLPKYDHSISNDGNSITFNAKTAGRGRTYLAGFLAMPFVFVGMLALLIGLPFVLFMGPKAGEAAGPVILTIVACGAIAFGIYALGSIQKVVTIQIDRDALKIHGKRYLREHVQTFNWQASGGYVSYGSASHNTGAALSYALSGSVSMKYGSKQVTLIPCLHPDRVEAVYDDLIRSLNKMGWNIS